MSIFDELDDEPSAGGGSVFDDVPASPRGGSVFDDVTDDEPAFRSWYADRAKKTGLSEDPDDPRQAYDYRAAFRAGAEPEYVKDADRPGYYWPSKYKTQGNARRFLSKAANGADPWSGSGAAYDTVNDKWVSEAEARKVAGLPPAKPHELSPDEDPSYLNQLWRHLGERTGEVIGAPGRAVDRAALVYSNMALDRPALAGWGPQSDQDPSAGELYIQGKFGTDAPKTYGEAIARGGLKFGVDVLRDPTTYAGAGLLGKAKRLQDAARTVQAAQRLERGVGAVMAAKGVEQAYRAYQGVKDKELTPEKAEALTEAGLGGLMGLWGLKHLALPGKGHAPVEEVPRDIYEPAPVREQGDVLGLEALRENEPTFELPEAPGQFHEPVWRGETPAGFERVVTAAPDAVGANIIDAPLQVSPEMAAGHPGLPEGAVWQGEVPPGFERAGVDPGELPQVWEGEAPAAPPADENFTIPEAPGGTPAYWPFPPPAGLEHRVGTGDMIDARPDATPEDVLARLTAERIGTPAAPQAGAPAPLAGLGPDFTLSNAARAAADLPPAPRPRTVDEAVTRRMQQGQTVEDVMREAQGVGARLPEGVDPEALRAAAMIPGPPGRQWRSEEVTLGLPAIREALMKAPRPQRGVARMGPRGEVTGRADVHSIKPALGLEGIEAGPKEIVKAIDQDGNNPLYREVVAKISREIDAQKFDAEMRGRRDPDVTFDPQALEAELQSTGTGGAVPPGERMAAIIDRARATREIGQTVPDRPRAVLDLAKLGDAFDAKEGPLTEADAPAVHEAAVQFAQQYPKNEVMQRVAELAVALKRRHGAARAAEIADTVGLNAHALHVGAEYAAKEYRSIEPPADLTERPPDFERDGVKMWVARFDPAGNELALNQNGPLTRETPGTGEPVQGHRDRLIAWTEDPTTGKPVFAGGVTNLFNTRHYIVHARRLTSRLGGNDVATSFGPLEKIASDLGWKQATSDPGTVLAGARRSRSPEALASGKHESYTEGGSEATNDSGQTAVGVRGGRGEGRGGGPEARAPQDGGSVGEVRGTDEAVGGGRRQALRRDGEASDAEGEAVEVPRGEVVTEPAEPALTFPPTERAPLKPSNEPLRLPAEPPSPPPPRSPVRGEIVGGDEPFQFRKDESALKIPKGDNVPEGLFPPPPKEPPLSGGPGGKPPASVRDAVQKRRRWFQPWKERVDTMGEPGEKIANRVRAYEREHEAATGKGAHAAAVATKDLSKPEWEEVQRAVDLGEKPKSEKVAKAAEAVRAVFKDVADRARKAGVLIDELENYWPHQSAEGRWDFDQMIDEYAQQKGVSREQASSELYDARRRAEFTRQRRNAHLERQRTGQLENYRKDKGVIIDYLDAANKRIAEANHFGKNLEKVEGLAKTILDRNDQKYVMDGLLGMTGRIDPSIASKVSGAARSVQAATKLTLGALSQLQSTAQTVSRGGVGNTVRGLLEMRTKSGRRAAELEAMRSSAIYDHLSGGEGATGGPTKGVAAKLPWLKATAWVDKQQRVLADNVAQKVIPQLYEKARGGDKNAIESLRELEVDHTQPLTDEAMLHGRKTFADLTQYRTRLSDMPLAASTPAGRVVMQMNNFNYQHGRFLGKTIAQARKGNVAPLLRYIGAATVLGEVVTDAKGLAKGYGIQGDEDADWKKVLSSKKVRIDLGDPNSPISERLQKIAKAVSVRAAQDFLGSGFGIYQGLADRASHAKKVVDVVGGPTIGDVVNVGDTALERGPKAGLKEAARRAGGTYGAQGVDEFLRSENDADERGDRPVTPGWIGRLHDVFEGKTTLGEAALRGTITGGSGTPEREDYGKLKAQRESTQAAQKAIEKEYPRTTEKEKKSTAEKIGSGKREEKRLGFEKQILDAFRKGNRREAYLIARRAKLAGFDFDKTRMKNLEAYAEE